MNTNDLIKSEMLSILHEADSCELTAIDFFKKVLSRVPTQPDVTPESLCEELGLDDDIVISLGSGHRVN